MTIPQPDVLPTKTASTRLEYQLMSELTLRQTPAGFEVFSEVVGLLDGDDDGFVDLFLVGGPRFWKRLLRFWLSILKELFLSRSGTLYRGFREVRIVDFLVNLSQFCV